MKKYLLAFLVILTLASKINKPVFAQGSNGVTGEGLEVTKETLDAFDPLQQEGSESPYSDQFSKPSGIINRAMEFIFPLAGMILFVMILAGGFQMLVSAGNQKGMEAGRQRVTMAIVGFVVLFSAYWIAQILGQILNIKIL